MCLTQLSPLPPHLYTSVFICCSILLPFYSLGAFWEEDEEDEEEEFLAKKKGKRPSKKKTRKCQEKFIGVQACIDSVALQNTAATRRWEQIIFNRNRIARECANNAIYDEEKLECYANVLDRIARRCPAAVDDFKEACKIPFEDEDFALDLAEELEDGKSLM